MKHTAQYKLVQSDKIENHITIHNNKNIMTYQHFNRHPLNLPGIPDGIPILGKFLGIPSQKFYSQESPITAPLLHVT